MSSSKYIFVLGGVASSLGKGSTAASIGALLEGCGYKVTMTKIDPYLNVDAGTMSPAQHGEVYVTIDGAEADLDLGNYERFTNYTTRRANTITTGQLYEEVIRKERSGAYLGECVQMVPHVSNLIRERIEASQASTTAITITEVGGTVGDIESSLYLEALRQLLIEKGKENVIFIYVTFLPQIAAAAEIKTKPTQHAVQRLNQYGLQPNILLCRASHPITSALKEKIARFTYIPSTSIISAEDLSGSLYELPLFYNKEGLTAAILEQLNLPKKEPDLAKWNALNSKIKKAKEQVEIGLIGKYMTTKDAYTSVREALHHAGIAQGIKVIIQYIDSCELIRSEKVAQRLSRLDGILIPGGFGQRGVLGKISAAHYARLHKLPCLGICLGLQTMIIEFARYQLGFKQANSTEFDPQTPHPFLDLLPEQRGKENKKGASMHLGRQLTQLVAGTQLAAIYNKEAVGERYRHRYKINLAYWSQLSERGLRRAAYTEDAGYTVINGIELPGHPFFIGVQYHPEFQSTPFAPHPLFQGFLKACFQKNKENKLEQHK